eukprot:gene23493-28444_t
MSLASQATLVKAQDTAARVKSFIADDQGRRRHPALAKLQFDSLAAEIKGKTANVENYLACFTRERELEDYALWIVE